MYLPEYICKVSTRILKHKFLDNIFLKAYILTNSLEKNTATLPIAHSNFLHILHITTKRREWQSRHSNFSGDCSETKLCCVEKLIYGYCHPLWEQKDSNSVFWQKNVKRLHEWHSSEWLFGIIQRGKGLRHIHSVPNLSFCPQSHGHVKRCMNWDKLYI